MKVLALGSKIRFKAYDYLEYLEPGNKKHDRKNIYDSLEI